MATIYEDEQTASHDLAQCLGKVLGREGRAWDVEGLNVVGDEVVLVRGMLQPAVAGVVDDGGGF